MHKRPGPLRNSTHIIELDGEIGARASRVPGKGRYTEEARRDRLEFLSLQTGKDLQWIDAPRVPAERLRGNIENCIGSIEIPIGIAGPLLVVGDHSRYLAYPPLATTEGALVSSVARGSTAITDSGGCRVHVVSQCMVRAPVFKFDSIDQALLFCRLVENSIPALREEIGALSRHTSLVSVETQLIGRIVHARFNYQTGDAAGQNRTTIGTDRCCAWLLDAAQRLLGFLPSHQQIEGNTSGDKKLSLNSFIKGRGTRVTGEVEISERTMREILRVDPDRFYEGYQLGVSGGISSGMIGYNINVANVIAAIFIATGQDVACVHESSVGHFHVERSKGGIYASMTLSNLVIGTVGGGTNLPGQREMLESLGCVGDGGVSRLAEIICASCLGLDLSTMAAVAADEFTAAHARLGKGTGQ